MKSVAIMTSGGDAAGMSPAVKCAVDALWAKGVTATLVYDGLNGLIDDDMKVAEAADVADIMHRGGTVLRSCRCPRFFEIENRKKAFENLQRRGIDGLIVIGGDGSFSALNQFYADFNIPFAGIPATIDNDIAGTEYCLGVDTALNVIRQAVDSIRDTADSFRRAFVIETMGRHCGYLAITSALASGAEICLVPEIDYNLDSIGERLRKQIAGGRAHLLAIVAEGTNMGDYMARWITDTIGMEARLTVLGHIQRGGSPTVYDRVMAYHFAQGAVNALLAGQTNQIIIHQSGSFASLPIEEVADTTADLRPGLIDLARPLCH